jgi:two-component system phosphate regulon response regulator PhoB
LNRSTVERHTSQESLVEQRVLVVEDETAIRDMIAFALKRAALLPMLAEDARTAQHLIAERLPDLILLTGCCPAPVA